MFNPQFKLLNIILLVIAMCRVDATQADDRPSAESTRTRSQYSSHYSQPRSQWTTWGLWGECTRSCGGGIRSRSRTCKTTAQQSTAVAFYETPTTRKPPLRCKGDRKQYSVCDTQPCPPGDVSGLSFRAVQCRVYNKRRVFGRVVNMWAPYVQRGVNPCALICEGEGIVYTFGKVTDGTQCRTDKAQEGLCVNGRCLIRSCDGFLGVKHVEVEDMCRVCGGKNETCTRHVGIFHSDLPSSDEPVIQKEYKDSTLNTYGYQEISSIPKGATNVLVRDNSSNYLALKTSSKFFLNGNWLIDWPGDVDAAGTSFSYVRGEDESETLNALGPTKDNLTLLVLIRDQNPGIYYEYWTPKEDEESITQSPLRESSATILPTLVSASQTILKNTTRYQSDSKRRGPFDNSLSNELPDHKRGPTQIAKHHIYETKYEQIKPNPKIQRKDVHNNSSLISLSNTKQTVFKHPLSTQNQLIPTLQDQRVNNEVIKQLLQPDKPRKKKKKKKKKKRKQKQKPYKRKQKKKNTKSNIVLPEFCNTYVCKKPKKAKEQFCTSDFVSYVEVVNSENWFGERRYEVLVHQSYKNIIPLMSKEFLWLDNPCNCPRMRAGHSYIVMGNTAVTRGREVRFVLGSETYVTKYNTKNLAKIFKIKQNQSRYCKPWRKDPSLLQMSRID